ncbi:MAG: Leupeptin-inactivating enzyme 1 precursor [Planctomycetota bacterium]
MTTQAMMLLRPSLYVLVAGLLSCPVVCAAAGTAAGNAGASAAEASAKLTLALDSIREVNLRSDVFFIASDELAGRDTPSEGLKIAARFLRARLERLGWQPGAEQGYFYRWDLDSTAVDVAASQVELTRKVGEKQETAVLQLGKDYWVGRGSGRLEQPLEGALVFGGDASKEALEKVAAEGRWVLVLDSGKDLREARRSLGRAGARGLLVIPPADYKGESYEKRFAGDLENLTKGSYQLARASDDRPQRSPAVSSVYLGAEAKQRLLGLLGVKESELATAVLELNVRETRPATNAGGKLQMENVCGYWPGSDPVLSKEVIILSAHYDHVGVGRKGIYNGADDNGSGTCGLLAVAEALTHMGPLRRSVLIMWVSGEEKGLWGSEAWNAKPWLPEGCKAVANINIDMIGRNAPDKLLITPTAEHKSYSFLTRVAESVAPLEGFPKLTSADEYWQRSDHYNFVKAGIPACFLFADVHEDYHQPTDDAEKLDYDKIRRVSRVVVRMLDALQKDKLDDF